MSKGIKFTRRSVLGGGTLAVAGLAAPKIFAASIPRPVVVELFTSQGCSSCPPADAVLGELKTRDDVIAITENVDYWDYLGWRDTFASKEYTQRQYAYARFRGDGQVYTPQMVFNGRTHTVGSRKSHVERAIAEEKKRMAERHVPILINEDERDITVNVQGGSSTSGNRGVLWIMVTEDKATQEIRRGENAGHSITYHNVMRKLIPAGAWEGGDMSLKLPRDDLMIEAKGDCIAVLQLEGHGEIVGAARITPKTT